MMIMWQGFVGPAFGNIILVDADPERLIQRMREYQAPVSVVASAAERKLAVGEDISGAGQAPNS